jgi:hypothetical protein
MNTKTRTASACFVYRVLLVLVFAIAPPMSAYVQTSGPDEQRRAWESGVYLPINSPGEQQHPHATEGPLGDDLPAVPIQPLAQQARRLQAALEFLNMTIKRPQSRCS